jgi:hypothetical protein
MFGGDAGLAGALLALSEECTNVGDRAEVAELGGFDHGPDGLDGESICALCTFPL